MIAVMAAGNRDPEQFPDPDTLDLGRDAKRHLAFGWAAHFCFGAALARIEGQIAFETLLRRLPGLRLEPGPLTWRENLGVRGLSDSRDEVLSVRGDLQVRAVAGALEVVREGRDRLLLGEHPGFGLVVEKGDRVGQFVDDVDEFAIAAEDHVSRAGTRGLAQFKPRPV